MIASQQLHDSLHQIRIPKDILSKHSPITINITQLANAASLRHIFSIEKEQMNEDLKSASHLSRTPITNKKVSKIKPTQMMSQEEEPAFIRAQRNQGVSNTTQLPSDRKIIQTLNNLNQNLSSPSKHFQKIYEPPSNSPKLKIDQIEQQRNNTFCDSSYTVYSTTCVEEFSYKEDQNIVFKESMEDKGKCIEGFNCNKDNALFCLFDGHGGDAVSVFLQKNYPFFFKKALEKYTNTIEEALKMSFIAIDNELRTLDLVGVGSTGCVVYITKENNSTVVYCANIGDTRASLLKPITHDFKRLSYDHRADDLSEKKRIIHQGGMVFNGRVMGQLMVSRAFGDFQLKSFGVKAEPYVSKAVINERERNQFVFIASDGVWDIMDEREIMKHLLYTYDTKTLSDKILARCIAMKAWDNLSIFAVKIC